jgi:hypothetical protein
VGILNDQPKIWVKWQFIEHTPHKIANSATQQASIREVAKNSGWG